MTTTLQPPKRDQADTQAAQLLRRVRDQVAAGAATAAAFSDEFTGKPSFLRAAAAFTTALPDVAPMTIHDVPIPVVLAALDQAIIDSDEVRPRNFNTRKALYMTRNEAQR